MKGMGVLAYISCFLQDSVIVDVQDGELTVKPHLTMDDHEEAQGEAPVRCVEICMHTGHTILFIRHA
jgi:hypothetical protein